MVDNLQITVREMARTGVWTNTRKSTDTQEKRPARYDKAVSVRHLPPLRMSSTKLTVLAPLPPSLPLVLPDGDCNKKRYHD